MRWTTRQHRRDPGEAAGGDTVIPLVALRGASKRYRWDSPLVLQDVTVEVRAGTLVKVRGVNGSGKSTLLRLLAGATVPTHGRRVAARSLAVGYSPERLAPAPPFSAADYLHQHARLRGCPSAEGEGRVLALAQRLALTSLLSERLGALSKGSLQKVVLIQALLGTPDILALDEPFSGLDLDAQQALVELLSESVAAGSAVVISDHRDFEAPPVADITWQLADGTVHQQGLSVPRSRLDGAADLPGVLASRREAGRLRLLVESTASDRVLAALLEQGWHVQSVAAAADADSVSIEARRRDRG